MFAQRFIHSLSAAVVLLALGVSLAQEKAPPTLATHDRWVTSVLFSTDGAKLCTTGGESLLYRPGDVQIWDPASGQLVAQLEGHPSAVWGAALSADGGTLAACGYDGKVLVWTGAPVPAPVAVSPPVGPSSPAPLAYTPPYLAEKILTSRGALAGERKQITVLFADLKGSMELLADRDPEEARQLLDPVLERLMAAVQANALWWPRERLPLVNGLITAFGGFGAITATVPVEALLQVTDWRHIFAAVALVTFGVAALIWFVVPERRAATGPQASTPPRSPCWRRL